MADDSDVEVEFDPKQLASFLASLKAFEPRLATATRRRLRRSGDETIGEMRRVVASTPAHYQVGVRAGIEAGLRTSVVTGKRRQGVRMSGTAARIPQGHKAMLRLLNKRSFRRRVFGSPHAWVVQEGRPYFGSVIKRHEDDMVAAVKQALGDAMDAMGSS